MYCPLRLCVLLRFSIKTFSAVLQRKFVGPRRRRAEEGALVVAREGGRKAGASVKALLADPRCSPAPPRRTTHPPPGAAAPTWDGAGRDSEADTLDPWTSSPPCSQRAPRWGWPAGGLFLLENVWRGARHESRAMTDRGAEHRGPHSVPLPGGKAPPGEVRPPHVESLTGGSPTLPAASRGGPCLHSYSEEPSGRDSDGNTDRCGGQRPRRSSAPSSETRAGAPSAM